VRRLEFIYPPCPAFPWAKAWRITWAVLLVAFWGGAVCLWGRMAWDIVVGLAGRP
jgi:hypothetical protein